MFYEDKVKTHTVKPDFMIEEKLASLNIILPSPPKPAGAYVPVVITGKLVFVSGQIPIKDGKVAYLGKVTKDISIEEAQKAAKLCIINALAQIKNEIGSLDKISKIVRVSGFVNSTPEFTEQPKIINAASDLLFEIFGVKGQHSRIAIGVASLPLNSCVEIDVIAEMV
jgi:enamine deaminase RidA (YjgF/YER057c/UK114 family)